MEKTRVDLAMHFPPEPRSAAHVSARGSGEDARDLVLEFGRHSLALAGGRTNQILLTSAERAGESDLNCTSR